MRTCVGRRSILAVAIGGLVVVGFAGLALAGYNVSANCTVATQLHYVINGMDQTPSGGTLPNGNPIGFICAGSTYVPLRWLAETLNQAVGWNGSTYTITVTGAGAANNGVAFNVASVHADSSGTTVSVKLTNSASGERYAAFALKFEDGFGNVLGTISGPQGSGTLDGTLPLLAGATQSVSVSSPSNFGGYVSIVIEPSAGDCPVACPPIAPQGPPPPQGSS